MAQPTHKHSLIQTNPVSDINTENALPQIDMNKTLNDIYATLAFLKRQNTDIYNLNDQILQTIKAANNSIVTTVSKPNQAPQLPCTLPITTTEDITRLEEYLKREENISALVK